jgi:uracil-DNA glycosylase
MLIIEGNDQRLREEFLVQVRERLGDKVRYDLGGPPTPSINAMLKLVHADTTMLIRWGLSLGPLAPSVRHMLSMALAATGSVIVLCTNSITYFRDQDMQELVELGFEGRLPVQLCHPGRPLEEAVENALDLWQTHVFRARQCYKFNASGSNFPGPKIMVVGEKVNPFAPYDQVRKLAFTTKHGCSLHLHAALLHHPRTRYYLTNAWKSDDARRNKDLLGEEIELVRPRLIVGMGLVAQSYLADLRVDFRRTFHPQFWRRFRGHDLAGLADALKPDFI